MRCAKCGKKITPDYGHCHKEGGCHEPQPHVCPPLSQELRRRIEANKGHSGSSFDAALRWVLREADSLEGKTGKEGT